LALPKSKKEGNWSGHHFTFLLILEQIFTVLAINIYFLCNSYCRFYKNIDLTSYERGIERKNFAYMVVRMLAKFGSIKLQFSLEMTINLEFKFRAIA